MMNMQKAKCKASGGGSGSGCVCLWSSEQTVSTSVKDWQSQGKIAAD